MALLKYNGNLISTGAGLLKYTATEPPEPSLINGGWKHKDTGVWTEFAEFYPDYGDNGGVVDFNGYAVIEPNSVGNVAHNISELIIREGCNNVYNIGLSQNPDTQEWMYEHLTLMDFPSTITTLGENSQSVIFNGLANVLTLIIRATTPPTMYIGNMQSPQAKLYVPDAAVATYKSHPNTSAYAAIIFPLSDIE